MLKIRNCGFLKKIPFLNRNIKNVRYLCQEAHLKGCFTLTMDWYDKKSRWKIYLAVAGAIILLVSLFYTRFLVRQLAAEARYKVEVMLLAYNKLLEDDPNDACYNCRDIDFLLNIVDKNTTIPLILAENGKPQGIDFVRNLEVKDLNELNTELQRMINNGAEPIVDPNSGIEIYYKEPAILNQLRLFPIIQLLLIAAFIFFGYVSFSSARRAEQNRVWVGMAKETAHQLGTPISGIVAWIEHLRLLKEGDAEVKEILEELGKDVSRLDLIADRFSKIGSEPKLETVNIFDELENSRAYMQRRAPRKVNFQFPRPEESKVLPVKLNSHLFNWVVENLLRNALDAMGPKGTISAEVYEDEQYVNIDLSDTGKGIPSTKFKTIFQPGFTTKKRGWGLGLSLAKRIIEDYHNGKIFVKKSEEDLGTTFTIRLPK